MIFGKILKANKIIAAETKYAPSLRDHILKLSNFDLNSIPNIDLYYSGYLMSIEKQTGKDISKITYPEFCLTAVRGLRDSTEIASRSANTKLDKSKSDALLFALIEILGALQKDPNTVHIDASLVEETHEYIEVEFEKKDENSIKAFETFYKNLPRNNR